ncbi:uncharacterized protein LOC101863049 isoform X2 [Aplysia californica]|uniref:Uncharacterized protein LOC101863049 isoform X2 n=1 Tax=Aplysia californica TaxID=6500 RepID=A0ABM1A859_APLCA|nr:uncharacterized protein LOC101863049 isoform X2 [Aplysia californica]
MDRRPVLSLAVSTLLCLLVVVSCQADVREELRALDLKDNGQSVQMVDNDPEFLVGVRGIQKPLCFHVEGSNDDVIRLLQDPETGVIVNARLFYDNLLNKTYLGAIMLAKGNFQLIAKQRYVMIDNIRLNWNDMTSMDVQGNRIVVGDNMAAVTFRRLQITLVVKRHFATVDSEMDYDMLDEDDASTRARNTAGGSGSRNRADIMPSSGNQGQGRGQGQGQNQGRRQPTSSVNRVLSSKRRRSLLVQNFFNVKEDKTVLRNLVVEVNNHNNKRAAGGRREVGVMLDAETPEEGNEDSEEQQLMSITQQGQARKRRRIPGKEGRRTHRTASTEQYNNNNSNNNNNNNNNNQLVSTDDVEGEESVEKRKNRTIFLGVYIADARGFSNQTHGLLGQFLYKNVSLERIRYRNGRMKARLLINGNRRTLALLTLRRNLALNTTRACWKIRHQGRDVVDGWYMDYLVENLRNSEMKEIPPSAPI